MDPRLRFKLSYAIVAALFLLLLQSYLSRLGHVETIPFSEFEKYLSDGRISEVAVSSDSLRGTLKEGVEPGAKHVIATRVEPGLAAKLDGYGVRYYAVRENTWLRQIVSWVVPIALFYLVWMLLFRRMAEKGGMGGGLMSIGKSKAKVYVETDTKVSFADVAGVDE